MKFRILFFILVLGLIIFLAVHSINISQVIDLLSDFPKPLILLLCFLSLIISTLKAWRFSILLRKNNISIPIWRMAKVYIAGQATTPLPGGEALRAFLLEKEIGAKPKDTSAAIVVQAFLIFVSSSIVAIIGSFLYHTLINVAVVTLIALSIAFYFFINESWIKVVVTGMKKVPFLRTHSEKIARIHEDIRQSMVHNGKGKLPSIAFLKSLALGIASNFVGGIMILILTHAFGIDMPFLQAVYVYALSVIISVISGVVPGGIGFTEGGMTGLLVYMRIPLSKAVAIVLLYRLVNLVFYILIGMLFFLLFYAKAFLIQNRNKKKK